MSNQLFIIWRLFSNYMHYLKRQNIRPQFMNHTDTANIDQSDSCPKQSPDVDIHFSESHQPEHQLSFEHHLKIKEGEEDPDISIDQDLALSKIDQLQDADLSSVEPRKSAMESPKINIIAAQAKIKELTKTAQEPPKKSNKAYCGCGNYYSCTSALYLHIRTKHNGVSPQGTLGGPKGIIIKKPYQTKNNKEDGGIKLEHKQNQEALKKQTTNMPVKRIIREPSSEESLLKNVEKTKNQKNSAKICNQCGKQYSCNSALNLHIKRKHVFQKQPQYKSNHYDYNRQNIHCERCSLSFGSKSALGMHINNKHNRQNLDDSYYHEDGVYWCGCALIYRSRSALNMHVKKKHNGNYPPGTIQKTQNRMRHSKTFQQVYERRREPSIYDSESEEQPKSTIPITSSRKRAEQDKRPYKCGCGRYYSCSSALNLHIKRAHNFKVPPGTIGGPRGFSDDRRKQSFQNSINEDHKKTCKAKDKSHYEPEAESIFLSSEKQDKNLCDKCEKEVQKGEYYLCTRCTEKHQFCSDCFWKKNRFTGEHEWQTRNDST